VLHQVNWSFTKLQFVNYVMKTCYCLIRVTCHFVAICVTVLRKRVREHGERVWGVARCCLPRSPGQPQHHKYQNRIWWWWSKNKWSTEKRQHSEYLWIEVSDDVVRKLSNNVWSTGTRTFAARLTVWAFTDLKRAEPGPVWTTNHSQKKLCIPQSTLCGTDMEKKCRLWHLLMTWSRTRL